MRRIEVARKFDEIIAFAEVESFLDTPVKRYSSGMYMRLAFSVAAHLEPEILLVDEVLAVGDAEFQAKCFAHIEGLRRDGVTIVIVTHRPQLLQQADKVLVLEDGAVARFGPKEAVLATLIRRAA
jgi:lipopolysaccharide transport system ATP-binding protein